MNADTHGSESQKNQGGKSEMSDKDREKKERHNKDKKNQACALVSTNAVLKLSLNASGKSMRRK